jgi:hypothetical protein
MTKDERMTKSEGRDARAADSLSDDGAMERSKPREAKCLRHSGFIILSTFRIRISSFSRV